MVGSALGRYYCMSLYLEPLCDPNEAGMPLAREGFCTLLYGLPHYDIENEETKNIRCYSLRLKLQVLKTVPGQIVLCMLVFLYFALCLH